ncbi:hypothetical protein [Rhizobium leguminosarum]|uniref:hypothetical protein n=1 Tax=Rhizobium leguminosarum TaxID=384 RepID=UPI0017B6BF54|nr:hypothetical protein [Rhizobium leguminosarum]MBA9034252.1 hypothetical protein [Rhizobium leguminosarum]
MEGVDRWIPYSAMTNPGRHASAIAVLPTEVGALIQIIQGVLVDALAASPDQPLVEIAPDW